MTEPVPRNAAFPWVLFLAALLVLLDAGAYWITDAAQNPQASTWERVYFRPGGDVTYFPYIRALADGNFGEPADFATHGQGRWNIPWLQLAPFALLVKLLGPWGFLAADLLLQVLRAGLLYLILQRVNLSRELAAGLALVISFCLFWVIAPWTFDSAWRGTLSFDRISRPLVTDPIFLGLILCLLSALVTPRGQVNLRALLGASALAGLVPHGDFHAFFYSASMYGCTALWLAWRERSNARAAWPRLLLSALPLLILLGYLLVLAGSTPPEVSRRMGVFPLTLARLPSPQDFYPPLATWFWLVGVVLLGGTAIALRRSLREDGNRVPRVILFGALVTMALIYLAPWVCITATGKMIQTYQFSQRIGAAGYYLVALGLCAGLRVALGSRPAPLKLRLLPYAPLALAALTLPITFRDALRAADDPRHPRRETPPYDQLRSYRADFREMERFLTGPRGAHLRKLATLDIATYSWWLTAQGKEAYLVDPFGSGIPDAVIEERLLRFASFCQVRDPAFILQPATLFFFHSCGKYQFSPAYTFGEPGDYAPGAVEKLKGRDFSRSLVLQPPISEIQLIAERLLVLRDLRFWDRAEPPEFDLIILNPVFTLYQPDPARFELLLENASFRIYGARARPN